MSSYTVMDLSGMLPLGEKWKILNQTVARTELHQIDDTLNDFKDQQPSSMFNLMKFLLADKFHRFDLMTELLYAGDTVLLNRIISKRWMYEGKDNRLTDSQFLMEELFPKVSCICRQKVLNKIGRYVRNDVKVDRIWNAVEQMYGFHVALPIIGACSKNVVTSVLAKREVLLSGHQVVNLLQKCPEIGLEYFKNHPVKCSKTKPKCSPMHYLYKYRLEDFLDVCINHPLKVKGFKIGKSRSTKLIRSHRTKFLEHPQETMSLLKVDRIQREFSSEHFQMFFESMLPSRPENAREYWKWVLMVPAHKRIDMVNQAYANLYQIDLNEYPNYMNEEYIFLLPEERRLQIVEWKIENEYTEWSLKGLFEVAYGSGRAFVYLPLKPISHSVPELKHLLFIEQNVELRATLSKYLIETCYLNDDSAELLSVLKLLSARTKNDQPEVREEILATIDKIKGMEFTKEHWDAIMEIIQTALVFQDENDGPALERLIGKLIAFRMERKLPLDDLVAMHIKLIIESFRSSFDNKYIKDPADQRVLLELYAKELEKLALTNHFCADGKSPFEEKKFVIKLIDRMWQFDCANKNTDVEKISLSSHSWLISMFERIAKDKERELNELCEKNGFALDIPKQHIKYIQWLRDEKNQKIDAFHGSDCWFSTMWLYAPDQRTMRHFLMKNPSHLLENWRESLVKMWKTPTRISYDKFRLFGRTRKEYRTSEANVALKYWNYSTLVSQTVNDCNELLHAALGDEPDEVEISQKCNALLVLSTLMEPTEFLALLTEFHSHSVDVFGEKLKGNAKILKALTTSLTNISHPQLALDAMNKLYVGDDLKLVVGAFHSQIQRASLTTSLECLRQQLVNVPASLQKLIIRLYCNISSVENKKQALKDVDIPNASIRYMVFRQIGKLFRSYPTKETWAMMKRAIESITVEDTAILKWLHSTPQLDTCPFEYISEYTDACFTAIVELEPSKVDNFIIHLLKIIEKLAGHLLDKILLHYSENTESFNSTLCIAYLKDSTTVSILEHRLSNICRVLEDVIKRGWDRKSENQGHSTQLSVLGIIDDLTNKIENSSEAWRENQICQTLLDKFKTLSTSQFFYEILTLHLALLHVQVIEYAGTERLQRFGSSFAKLVDSLAKDYGNEIILMALDRMESKIKRIFSAEFDNNQLVVVELIDEILDTSKSRSNKMLAIRLLGLIKGCQSPQPNNFVEILEEIIRILNESNDVVIQTFHASSHRVAEWEGSCKNNKRFERQFRYRFASDSDSE